jgi:hypothetical protein
MYSTVAIRISATSGDFAELLVTYRPDDRLRAFDEGLRHRAQGSILESCDDNRPLWQFDR